MSWLSLNHKIKVIQQDLSSWQRWGVHRQSSPRFRQSEPNLGQLCTPIKTKKKGPNFFISFSEDVGSSKWQNKFKSDRYCHLNYERNYPKTAVLVQV
jgi:hypothetical protein